MIPTTTLAQMAKDELIEVALPPNSQPRHERDRRMCRLYTRGYTMAEIGALYHLQPSSIGEILRRCRVLTRPRGRQPFAEKKNI